MGSQEPPLEVGSQVKFFLQCLSPVASAMSVQLHQKLRVCIQRFPNGGSSFVGNEIPLPPSYLN